MGTIVFSIFFGLTLLVFDALLRIATPLGKGAVERVGVWFQKSLVAVYRFAWIRPELERSPAVRDGTPYILVSNHQSMFDIPLFAWALPAHFPKYISKRSLSKWIPGISYNLRHGGHALIDRSNRNSAVEAIRKLARAITADGSSVVIFPEGTRGRDGRLGPFKPAGLLALLDEAPNAPVVPICIHDSWRILENDFRPIPAGIHLRVWIGDPIPRSKDEDRASLLKTVERQIADRLARFRADDGLTPDD